MRTAVVVLALVLAAAPAAPAWAQRAPERTQGGVDAAGLPGPTLRPGDALRVRVWREPDLSGEYTIDETGAINLPKLGIVRVVDEPVDRLKERIVAAYREYVLSPVEVTPLLRIQVGGAVRTPGLYRVDPTMTMGDALALAGGATPAGRSDRVRLVRGGGVVVAELSPSAALAGAPLQSGDQLIVPERSWFSRHPGILIGAVSALATLVWTFRRQN